MPGPASYAGHFLSFLAILSVFAALLTALAADGVALPTPELSTDNNKIITVAIHEQIAVDITADSVAGLSNAAPGLCRYGTTQRG